MIVYCVGAGLRSRTYEENTSSPCTSIPFKETHDKLTLLTEMKVALYEISQKNVLKITPLTQRRSETNHATVQPIHLSRLLGRNLEPPLVLGPRFGAGGKQESPRFGSDLEP